MTPRVTEVTIPNGSYESAVVRWSPDGSASADIGLRTRNGGSAGVRIDLNLANARLLVEVLHEAISAVAAWEVEKAASR